MSTHDGDGRDSEASAARRSQTPGDEPADSAGAPPDAVEPGSAAEQDGTVEQDASSAPVHPVPAPGEPPGDMWPGVHAVRGGTDENDDVEGVEGIALAPPGKPDGEADTRP